jgi:hypothetical protein
MGFTTLVDKAVRVTSGGCSAMRFSSLVNQTMGICTSRLCAASLGAISAGSGRFCTVGGSAVCLTTKGHQTGVATMGFCTMSTAA